MQSRGESLDKLEWLIGDLFAEPDPTRSLADSWIRDSGGVSTPDQVVGSGGCEVGLSRLVAVNRIREYSLEMMVVVSV